MGQAGAIDAQLAAVESFVAAAVSHCPAAIREALDGAGEALGPGLCIDGVLIPALRRIAQQGPPGAQTTGVALAVETARAWLDTLAARAPAPHRRAPVVLACGPRERHSAGLEALSVLLKYQRQPCRMLGARASARRVSIAVEVTRPAAVVLVAHHGSALGSCVDVLQTLNGLGMMTFYAGAAFDTVLTRHQVPGFYLGTSFQRACATVIGHLGAESADTPPRTDYGSAEGGRLPASPDNLDGRRR